jgi:hypothetical protein
LVDTAISEKLCPFSALKVVTLSFSETSAHDVPIHRPNINIQSVQFPESRTPEGEVITKLPSFGFSFGLQFNKLMCSVEVTADCYIHHWEAG